jgi:DNA uptake protein ComE-like DNA-binding protein
MLKHTLHIFLIFSALQAFAQRDTTRQSNSEVNQDAIENLILSTQNDNGFELNTTFEHLEYYSKHKLNLNKTTREELSGLGILTEPQVEALFQYRKKLGDLIAIQELQAIPTFDLGTIRKILPFVTVDGMVDDYQISLGKMLQEADNQLYIRTATFREPSTGLTQNQYLGNGLQHYLRFKRSFGTKMSIGLTLEKDKGEPYFYPKKIYGADFISAHVAYKGNRFQVILGDFAANFGQGLLIFQDFAVSKSPFITDLKRQHNPIRAYSSVAESTFLRGIGLTYHLSKKLDWTMIGSLRKRDASVNIDTTQAFDEVFSSLMNAGLHRTETEILNKNVLQNLTIGTSLKWKSNGKHLSFNALYNQFDKTFQRAEKPYSQFAFTGKSLIGFSTDYGYVFRNFNFFGETAISQNGGKATVNGLLVAMDKHLNFSVLHRYYAKDYQSFFAAPVSEATGANNENGLYTGLSILPTSKWKIESYVDVWKHEWLRFQVNAPSQGYEFYNRITFTLKRKLDFYVQYRFRDKEKNSASSTSLVTPLAHEKRQQLRLNLQYQMSPEIEWESRVEWSRVEGIQPLSKGFLAYQDLKYKPKGFPVSFTARYCVFDTDDFNSRIYTFENSLMYLYSIPPLYGKGSRTYFNIRYVPTKKIMIEGRFAQTYLPQNDAIGTGKDLISSNTKTEFVLQARYNF